MRTLLFAVGLLAAAVSSAAAQTVNGITVTNVGSYKADTTSAPSRSGQLSPTGTVGTDAHWQFTSDSLEVPGRVGTHFGIEFRIDGSPAQDDVTFYLTLTFPPQGIRNPNTGEIMYSNRVAFPHMKIGALCLLGYGFDTEWEIVPGPWTAQIWYRDRMLAERTFTVSKAN